MGIALDFLIKHVRPIDDGVELLCSAEVRTGLRAYGMTDIDIDTVFTQWAATAALSPSDTRHDIDFVHTAWTVSEARWDQLYPTAQSTVVFLNAPLLKQLSHDAEMNTGSDFTFDPHETIPVAVTITRASQRYQIAKAAQGFEAAADQHGMCIHFAGLNP